MKSLQDALYNYLTIKIVSDERPDDFPAKETTELFKNILVEEFGVSQLRFSKDENMYHVQFEKACEEHTYRFPIDLIEVMLNQIKSDPDKYENFPTED